MIFKYDITVPLTYNKLEIQSKNPDSELRYEIEKCCEEKLKVLFKTYEVPGCGTGYEFEDIMQIKIYNNPVDNRPSGNIRKDDCRLMCEMNGLLVDDEIYAKEFAEKFIDRICKGLSLVFIKHNDNRHLYQPRVEPMWSEAVFSRCEYGPFVDVKRKILEEKAGNKKMLHLEERMYIHDSIYSIARITIPPNEINIKEWISEKDDVVDFLMNEYYSALGTENIKSKFFHLFTIIEFCEKHYEEHNGSSRLLTDEEVDLLIEEIEKPIEKIKRKNIISIVKNSLVKANDIGRAGKLENILKWMGIERYRQFGTDKIIDRELLSDIIEIRNKSFHGVKENAEYSKKKYAEAVEVLLYIAEKILDFVMMSSKQNENDGV